MSIKKKFATAVATAGLLAGLFGSALVPTVSAARGDTADAPKASLTKYKAGADRIGDSFWNLSADEGNYEGEMYMAIGKPMTLVMGTFWSEATGAFDAGSDEYSIGFRLRNADGPIDTASLSVVSSNANVQVAFAYDGDDATQKMSCDDNDLEGAFGSTDAVKTVAATESASDWNTVADSLNPQGAQWYALCVRAKSATKPGISTVTITANGVKLPPITIKSLGDLDSLELSTANTTTIAEDNAGVGKYFSMVGKDSAGNVINFPVKNNAFPNDLQNWVDEYDFAMVPVDNQKGSAIPSVDGLAPTFGTTTWAFNAVNLRRNTCESESFAGAGDGDAGHSYDIAYAMTNEDGDEIVSNEVKITCSGATSTYTVSNPVLEYTSGAADWAASSVGQDDEDGVIGIYVTVKDADGKALGITGDINPGNLGGRPYKVTADSTLGFGIELDDYSALDVDYVDPRVGADGKVLIGTITPDVTAVTGTVFPIDVVLSDWDANYDGTAALADLKKTLTYTVGSSTAKVYSATKAWSKAHTKVVVSVAWGAVCSNAMVTFDIEKGNGDMILVPIRRRANAAGTATLVLEKRRTVNYVTAISCTGLGSIEVGPVRARFK